MSRSMFSLSPEQRTPCDLDACIAHVHALNQHNRHPCATPCPTASSRWLSHDVCTPHPIALTSQDDSDGGLSGLVGATLAFSVTRSLCAASDGSRGGSGDDPASLVVLEVAAQVDQYIDYAQFCADLHQADTGRRYRLVAGLPDHSPGEDDLCNFRYRVGDVVIHQIMAVAVDLVQRFGLIKGALLSSDGPLEPSSARSKGCPDACQGCHAWPIDAAGRHELCDQLHRGAKRLQLPCPFPDVVTKGRAATATTGTPRAPKVSLLGSEAVCDAGASTSDRQQVASLLGRPEDQVPPLQRTWCHVHKTPQGELLGSCPKGPSDLAATIGSHLDTTDSSKTAHVFGSCHLTTTDLNRALGLALPLGTTPYAADTHAGHACIAHREALALPMRPGQVHLGDAANALIAHSRWLHDHGGLAVVAYNRRHEPLDPASLRQRGSDHNGTPSAPCGRLCRSNGDDSPAQSRQSVCGLPWPPDERRHCPHRFGVLGSSHHRSFKDHPRLLGPMQRGTPAWQRLYAARSARERTNSDNQEVIAKTHPLRMRGLKAFRCAGAIRTLAQRLRRAVNFVLDVTSTLSQSLVAQT